MGCGWVALEVAREAGHGGHGITSEPPMPGLVVEDVDRSGRVEECGPRVEDLLELGVQGGIEEGDLPCGRVHRPVEDRVDGEAHQPRPVVGRGGPEDSVDELNHVAVVAHLRRTCGRPFELLLIPQLLEHLVELHVQRGITLDQVLQLLHHGMEWHRLRVDVTDEVAQPGVQDPLVARQPAADAVRRCGHTRDAGRLGSGHADDRKGDRPESEPGHLEQPAASGLDHVRIPFARSAC